MLRNWRVGHPTCRCLVLSQSGGHLLSQACGLNQSGNVADSNVFRPGSQRWVDNYVR
jgi:hypothetical protein